MKRHYWMQQLGLPRHTKATQVWRSTDSKVRCQGKAFARYYKLFVRFGKVRWPTSMKAGGKRFSLIAGYVAKTPWISASVSCR